MGGGYWTTGVGRQFPWEGDCGGGGGGDPYESVWGGGGVPYEG